MIYFFTVAAPARAGTMWFSRLLTTEHSFCYHELTTLLHPYPSNVALVEWYLGQVADHEFEQAQRRWLLQCYPEYFARLWERALSGQHIVGNSDNGVLEFLPALWLVWPDMNFIFSTRNGINCVQSYFVSRSRFPAEELARLRSRFKGRKFFHQCCYFWMEHVGVLQKVRGWLEGRAQCFDTTLENMTSDLGEIRRLWDWLGIGEWEEYEERNRLLMSTPVNARTNARRIVDWEEIWEGWKDEQRETFRTICGETQTRLGYSLP
jgi:hypothetical protein